VKFGVNEEIQFMSGNVIQITSFVKKINKKEEIKTPNRKICG